MPGPSRNLSLMLLPQRWDGANLIANLLLIPNNDPTVSVPLISGSEQPFAAAQPVLRAALLPGLVPEAWSPSILPGSINYIPITLAYSSAQAPIFAALKAEYTPVILPLSHPGGVIRKDLPESFRAATGFATPDPKFFTAGDGFGCALNEQTPNLNQVSPSTIQWGEILSYALRQPLIAQAMGLAYLQVSIPLDPTQVSAGGWIWIEIDTTNLGNWYAKLVTEKPGAAVFTYAARLPALTSPQDVFAAILFPTLPGAYDASIMDAAQYEADLYLDGFAKLVHADQPSTADSVTGDADYIVPGTDAGIQIGWDDIQVTQWVNRQIKIAQDMALGTATQELPFTVLGYRVDVRENPASPSDPWASLCAASGTLNAASVFTTSFTAQDLCVEPTPVQNAGPGQDYWLPRYFAQWRGRTLVVNDKYGYAFSGGQPPAPSTPPPDFSGTLSEWLSGVDLRYGNSYQFRARLADLTGGGPAPGDSSPDDAGAVTLPFRRYVPPKKVALTLGSIDASGNQSLTVDRPSINYPEMVFTGAADQSILDALFALTPTQPPVRPFPPPPGPPRTVPPFQAAVLDSDVVTLQIIVEAEAPKFDTGPDASMADADTPPSPGQLDGNFRVLYNWSVDFPALATPVAIGASTPIQLTLQPTQVSQVDSTAWWPSSATPTVLPIPTGRNVRIRLRGLGADDPDNLYYGNSVARTGLTSDIRVRFEAAIEGSVLLDGNLDQQLQAYYLRDLDNSSQDSIVSTAVVEAIKKGGVTWRAQDYENLAATLNAQPSTPLELLASALNLPLTGQTITAPPGRRILFGAQSTLRHTLPQDRSSITFSTQKDLINHWIVVQHLILDRDWTWRGLAQDGAGQLAFDFQGMTYSTGATPPPKFDDLGSVDLPTVVSSLATQQSGAPPLSTSLGPRDQTEIYFFSTIESTVGLDGYPSPTEGSYQLIATFTSSPTTPVQIWTGKIEVPITANPRQIPQLVSAGIAESAYEPSQDYSSTSIRQRSLWLEFDQSPQDPHDAYFVRVMNYGPDPLLMSYPVDITPAQDTPISLDPEPIRMITPDSVDDSAGLSAMTRVEPSGSSPVHFLIPLPDGISPEALDPFGFWTYEIRCGHLQWSTAQGRFGRPFRVAGVQHPCRHLIAAVDRKKAVPSTGGAKQECIVCSADLAQTVLSGQSLTFESAPQTQIWFLLYAQLRRVDGQAYRNLLLGKLPGELPLELGTTGVPLLKPTAGNKQVQSITVEAAFSQSAVEALLADLLLPRNTPLSVLAVELFNVENQVIRDVYHGAAAELDSAGAPGGGTATATAVAIPRTLASVGNQGDPLGNELGSRRILRVSPLTPVSAIC